MSRHQDHVHPTVAPYDLPCKHTKTENIKDASINWNKRVFNTHQPSALTTSGFFLNNRSRQSAAFFLTRGLQLPEIYKAKKPISSTVTYSYGKHATLPSHLLVTFEHQVPTTLQILVHQYFQPTEEIEHSTVQKQASFNDEDGWNNKHDAQKYTQWPSVEILNYIS